MTARFTMAAALVIASAALATSAAQGQDTAAGEVLFKKHCAICHMIGDGAKNRVAPPLNGLDGRKTGTIAGFAYSSANRNSGIVWSETEFLDYIKDPKAKIPNTKMIFPGLKDANEAKALWTYLSQFGTNGKKK